MSTRDELPRSGVSAQRRTVAVNGQALSRAGFPLTLTLSPREREQPSASKWRPNNRPASSDALHSKHPALPFSLSLGERAGARGKRRQFSNLHLPSKANRVGKASSLSLENNFA